MQSAINIVNKIGNLGGVLGLAIAAGLSAIG